MVTIQAVTWYVQTNVSLYISEDNGAEYRHKRLTRVNHRHDTTSIYSILELHSFENKWNVLKYITQHNSLYENFNSLGKSSSKLCKFKTYYFDKIKNYIEPLDFCTINKKWKSIVKIGIVSTPGTTKYIE